MQEEGSAVVLPTEGTLHACAHVATPSSVLAAEPSLTGACTSAPLLLHVTCSMLTRALA